MACLDSHTSDRVAHKSDVLDSNGVKDQVHFRIMCSLSPDVCSLVVVVVLLLGTEVLYSAGNATAFLS
jgi:hypothetical protein